MSWQLEELRNCSTCGEAYHPDDTVFGVCFQCWEYGPPPELVRPAMKRHALVAAAGYGVLIAAILILGLGGVLGSRWLVTAGLVALLAAAGLLYVSAG